MLSEDQRRFVEDVLSLYSALQLSFKALEDKSGISAQELLPQRRRYGPRTVLPIFSGFFGGDGKLEEEYWLYCVEIIEQQGRFSELDHGKYENFISPGPRVDAYQRMLAAWEEMGRPDKLSKEQVRKLEWAEMHPENRPTLGNKVRSFFRRWRRLLAAIAGGLTGITILFVSVWAFIIGLGLTRIEWLAPLPFNIAVVVIAFLVGYLVWEVISEGSIALKERAEYQSLIAGFLFFGVVGQIWIELFYGSMWGNFLVVILEIATAALAYYLSKMWLDRRLKDRSG